MKGNKTILVNAAIAGLLATGSFVAMTSHAVAADVQCTGVNACKGKGECGGEGHACAGNNSCKGKGWVKKASAEECTKAGGTVVGADAKKEAAPKK